MILFNLRPYREYERKKKIHLLYFYFALVLLSAVFVSFLVNKAVSFFVETQRERVSFLAQKVEALANNQRAINNFDKEIKKIIEKKKIIEGLENRRFILFDALHELVKKTPKGIFLNYIHTSSSGEVEISGVATSNQIISDFLHELQKSQVITLEKLVNSEIWHTKFGDFQKFSLTVFFHYKNEDRSMK